MIERGNPFTKMNAGGKDYFIQYKEFRDKVTIFNEGPKIGSEVIGTSNRIEEYKVEEKDR